MKSDKLIKIVSTFAAALVMAALVHTAAAAELMPGDRVGSLIASKNVGGTVDLGKYGKQYILTFFVPGRKEDSDQLAALKKILAKKDYAGFVPFAITRGKDAKEKGAAASFLKEKKLNFTLLFDPNSDIARKFGAKEFPAIFIVDAGGILRTVPQKSVTEVNRKLSFEDFLKYVKAKKEIPFIDLLGFGPSSEGPRALIGKPAPNFTAPDLRNSPRTLSSYRGKSNVLVIFWSATCSHCLQELPRIQKIYLNRKTADNFEILAVTNPASGDGIENVKEIVKRNMFTFPVVTDPNGSVSGLYGVQAVPSIFFVNKKGIIVDYISGSSPYYAYIYQSMFTDPGRLGR